MREMDFTKKLLATKLAARGPMRPPLTASALAEAFELALKESAGHREAVEKMAEKVARRIPGGISLPEKLPSGFFRQLLGGAGGGTGKLLTLFSLLPTSQLSEGWHFMKKGGKLRT